METAFNRLMIIAGYVPVTWWLIMVAVLVVWSVTIYEVGRTITRQFWRRYGQTYVKESTQEKIIELRGDLVKATRRYERAEALLERYQTIIKAIDGARHNTVPATEIEKLEALIG